MRRAFADHAYLPQAGEFLHYVAGRLSAAPDRARYRRRRASRAASCARARLAWLDAQLERAPDRPTVLFMHHPPFLTGLANMDWQNCHNGEALGALLERHRQVTRLLCGHVHRPIHLAWHGVTASIAPSPSHSCVFDLNDGGLARFRPRAADLRAALLARRRGPGQPSHLHRRLRRALSVLRRERQADRLSFGRLQWKSWLLVLSSPSSGLRSSKRFARTCTTQPLLLHLPAHRQQPRAQDRAAVPLDDVVPDHEVHVAGLVLQRHEEHAARGGRALAAGDDAGGADPLAMAGIGHLLGRASPRVFSRLRRMRQRMAPQGEAEARRSRPRPPGPRLAPRAPRLGSPAPREARVAWRVHGQGRPEGLAAMPGEARQGIGPRQPGRSALLEPGPPCQVLD